MLCYSLQENNHITLGSIVYYTILGDTTLTHSDIFFLFISRNILGLVEVHIETSLRLDRDPWKNFRPISQPEIRFLDHLFGSPVKELLVQP